MQEKNNSLSDVLIQAFAGFRPGNEGKAALVLPAQLTESGEEETISSSSARALVLAAYSAALITADPDADVVAFLAACQRANPAMRNEWKGVR